MYSPKIHHVGWCVVGMMTIGCGKKISPSSLSPIKVEVIGKLDVSVGDDVNWAFKASRNGREISIIDVSSPRIPFGVKPVYEPGKLGYSGKIQGRQFRGGLLKVTAFDQRSCEDAYESMKKMVEKNVKETKATDVSIPVNPCAPSAAGNDPALEEHRSSAYFYWHLIDGPDAMPPENYRAVLTSYACHAAEDCPGDASKTSPIASKIAATQKDKSRKTRSDESFVVIPKNEAPHTIDVVIGECARFERAECGTDKGCLWSRNACVTASTSGHIAVSEDRP